MKKVLLTMFMAVTTMIAMAQTKNYTETFIVTINGESTNQPETSVSVEKMADNTYTLSLLNFVMMDGENPMPVGNIVLTGITPEKEENKITYFTTTQTIKITAGDADVSSFWLADMLPEVPVTLTGKMDSEHIYCSIDIDLSEAMGQIINVVFGDESKVTSINNIEVENGANVIYDITGRKVEEITKAGIYIVNGKKVFVK